VGLLAAAPPRHRDPRIEIGGSAGWTFSDGVTFSGVIAGDGNVYNSIEPKDSFSYTSGGYFVNRTSRSASSSASRRARSRSAERSEREIGDMSVDNYHGFLAYHFGDVDAKARPTSWAGAARRTTARFPSASATSPARPAAETQFSTTWGLGVKLYPPQGGHHLLARWTPTYIKSDAEGWWCDPYWGCYVVGDSPVLEPVRVLGRHRLPLLENRARRTGRPGPLGPGRFRGSARGR
jgi:hypothetical protein